MFVSITCMLGILATLSPILRTTLEIAIITFFFFLIEKTESTKTSDLPKGHILNTDISESKSLQL